MIYNFFSNSRDYSEYIIDPKIDIDPIESKLFHNDSFEIINNNIIVKKSVARDELFHCGVLILQGNKTFGKTKKGKMYYKCIPNNKYLPIFLIPYELKIGFHKNYTNKYVLFSFDQWHGKHPMGVLKETFGDVDNFSSYCNYQLWTKKLVYSLSSFQREVRFLLKRNEEEIIMKTICDKYNVIDKTNEHIFTIDPDGSKDLDDAFSVKKQENGSYKICIYIANVFLIIDHFNLWKFLTKRVSTIYLPENKRNMLPDSLSDDLCSLLTRKKRISFVMEFIYDDTVHSINYYHALINVSNNYVYDSKELLNDSSYIELFNATKKLNNNIIDSHDVVSYWMKYMNIQIANVLYCKKTGVFRVATKGENVNIDSKNNETKNMLEQWKYISSSYQLFSEKQNMFHELLENKYVHITSPIRRQVDLINQIYFYKYYFKHKIGKETEQFLTDFEDNIDRMNIDMKSIKKIQMECELLYFCNKNEDLMNEIYDGFVFNESNNNDNVFQYNVYIKTLNKMSFFKTEKKLIEDSIYRFKLFLFDKENSGYKKIRLSLVDN
tara:strand:+ start:1996 stop:3645 length:1650 start_codon:yes stop_codon:yes gene_type:complete